MNDIYRSNLDLLQSVAPCGYYEDWNTEMRKINFPQGKVSKKIIKKSREFSLRVGKKVENSVQEVGKIPYKKSEC